MEMETVEVGGLVIKQFPVSTIEEPRLRLISVGAFFDRFGPQKWAILASNDASVRAVIADASVRKFIDLDNTDLPAGLAILQAAGFGIDPEAIVSDPILANELP